MQNDGVAAVDDGSSVTVGLKKDTKIILIERVCEKECSNLQILERRVKLKKLARRFS